MKEAEEALEILLFPKAFEEGRVSVAVTRLGRHAKEDATCKYGITATDQRHSV